MNNEPVAWINREKGSGSILDWEKDPYSETNIPLYTHPVKELTDEEIKSEAKYLCHGWHSENPERLVLFARAILRKAQSTCNGFCGEYECKENQDGCKRKAQEK